MEASDEYRITFSGDSGSRNQGISRVEFRSTHGGVSQAVGGTPSATGTSDPVENLFDSDPNTTCVFNVNYGNASLTYLFTAALVIKEVVLTPSPPDDNLPTPFALVIDAFIGAAWERLVWHTVDKAKWADGVPYVISMFEVLGNAKFSDSTIASRVLVNRSSDGGKQDYVHYDQATGDFYVLTEDAGPFDVLIHSDGYRPLVQELNNASGA